MEGGQPEQMMKLSEEEEKLVSLMGLSDDEK